MRDWFRFLKSLETEGGSIVVLLCLVLLFSYFVKADFKDAESQLYFILGALVGLLKGNTHQEIDKPVRGLLNAAPNDTAEKNIDVHDNET